MLSCECGWIETFVFNPLTTALARETLFVRDTRGPFHTIGCRLPLKACVLKRALTKKETIEAGFYRLPYEPDRQELLTMLREVNRVRSRAGLEPVSRECSRFRRRLVRPFDEGV